MAKTYADTTRSIVSFDGTEVIVVQDGTSPAPSGFAEMKKTTLGALRTFFQDGVAHSLVFKGSCTWSELSAKTDMKTGDMWNVTDKNGQNYAWTGSAWDALGETIDISGKADKTYVDTELGKKANSSTTYNKTEVDNKLSGKANSSDVYTKAQTDTYLGNKADKSTTYTKTEVDNSIGAIASDCAERAEAIQSKIGIYDFTQVDDNVTFILDGDAEKEMASLVQATPAYPQDAIMLSLEPVIPTTDTHNFGIKGQIAIDSDYLYVCVADNEWKKIPLQSL